MPVLIMLFAYTSICLDLWKMPSIRREFNAIDTKDSLIVTKKYGEKRGVQKNIQVPLHVYLYHMLTLVVKNR